MSAELRFQTVPRKEEVKRELSVPPQQVTPGPQVTVTIRTVDGETWTHEFNLNETVKSVIQQALAHFKLQPAPGVIYHLLFEGRLLVDSKTLEQEGVKNGSVLLLGTEAQVGKGSDP